MGMMVLRILVAGIGVLRHERPNTLTARHELGTALK
jgi:hypothetical protein